ncbi:4-hydroxy-tetrahydrodipicolinate reductase [Lactobacillus sp. ESL0236]|uniref:4-hydroxy-tetrahydrodipicolinate reductase n=1 Tax=unclassified Lactobacillus TaxID=2620435 RepID=UPI000EFD6011|nr:MULTISPECIES: 4-hydroxy-tetrahydrodipicolinate reductase [unclassified Lactobacillus]RMC38700.1 4-hydroxy-tetrahydrodipicolinate reductase [Lactobacillus sp. ESL0237]RMC43045.1 4-hydroxy-tetrahydrodipicolinate reductase [Lactobacillus sp. ESL0234]RMC43899.1 4-hydroxy-tetrahydrodipicolinate reductase [Lactobacillus sp. ESL0236]
MKKIIVAGATGSMGQQVVKLIENQSDCELVAVLAPNMASNSNFKQSVKCYKSLSDINNLIADIWIDFTTPVAVFENTKFAIEHQIRPLIGTSGLTTEQITQLRKRAQEQKIGGLIVPNFGLSAVLLMKFAQEAARYFPDAEVIEMHHADKLDAPSATAIATARLIAANQEQAIDQNSSNESRARGENYAGIPIHSVRLPGYVAHEQVLFGGLGEALTLRQDSFDRSSFMSGVKLALEHIMELPELVVGLEKIL